MTGTSPMKINEYLAFAGNVQQKVEAILQEEREFNVQYQQWKKQYDDWREQNQSKNKDRIKEKRAQWVSFYGH